MADPRRHDEAKRLFRQALDRPTADRDAFLRQACGDDTALLRHIVEMLLAFEKEAAHFLEQPVVPWPELATLVGSTMPDTDGDAAPLVAGVTLAGRYRIVALLGRGGMGEVYRADDLKLDQDVALKLVPRAWNDDDASTRFFAEVRSARSVSHRHVCRVHDLVEADGLFILSMELIEGETLETLLLRIGRLPSPKTLDLAEQLCRGLEAIHDKGLLHRDLKPANIMIDDLGEVRITDFGLASAIGDPLRGGTPAYLAPELWSGETSSVQSDLYALGLVLYEIFTGERVFTAGSETEYRRLHAETTPARPSDHLPGLGPAIEDIILACLEKQPENRPVSACTVADRLAVARDRPSAAGRQPTQGTVLRTLLASELVDAGARLGRCSDAEEARLIGLHSQLVTDLIAANDGREMPTRSGFFVLFERPWDAVRYALSYHRRLARLACDRQVPISARVGIHLGELAVVEDGGDRPHGARSDDPGFEGWAKLVTHRLMASASGGQILLSREAFDIARRGATGQVDAEQLVWLSHGTFLLGGLPEGLEIFEVGVDGDAPRTRPRELDGSRRLVVQPTVTGWRPAHGQVIPRRRSWRLRRKLGQGSFGEVWLAEHAKLPQRRVFKFCFDAASLRTLQREITVFRLLKEDLGDRRDIVTILDWNFERAPYFIESEHSAAGSLADWAAARGGLGKVALETRLEIVAQVARALAAAHSVGVLHKDVKPGNILISDPEAGGIQAQIGDFGLGTIAEKRRLRDAGITVLGSTRDASQALDAGTRLYQAPEIVEGRRPRVQSDVYSLGVVLYQLVVGDLRRALAPGWRRDIGDRLLVDDIADAVDGRPDRRFASAALLADRLQGLGDRRRARDAALHDAEREQQAVRRRRRLSVALVSLSIVALMVGLFSVRLQQEAERANSEAETATLVAGFLDDLLQTLNQTAWRTDDEVFEAQKIFLDVGMERLREQQLPPAVRARLLGIVGRGYLGLGLLAEADGPLVTALEIHHQIDATSVETSLGRLELGRLRLMAEELAESTSLLERVVEELRHHRHVDDSLADATYWLAMALDLDGETERALALALESLELVERAGGDAELAMPRTQLIGNLWRKQQEPRKAEKMFARALALGEALHGRRDARVARTLLLMARNLVSQDDPERWAEAQRLYLEVATSWQEELGERHRNLGVLYNELGRFRLSVGDPADALCLLGKSLSIRLDSPERRHGLGVGLDGVARALAGASELELAQCCFRAALDHLREGSTRWADVRVKLSDIAFRQRRFPRCLEQLDLAAPVLDQEYSASDWQRWRADAFRAACQVESEPFEALETTLRRAHAALRGDKPDSVVLGDVLDRLSFVYDARKRSEEAHRYRDLRSALDERIRRHAPPAVCAPEVREQSRRQVDTLLRELVPGRCADLCGGGASGASLVR